MIKNVLICSLMGFFSVLFSQEKTEVIAQKIASYKVVKLSVPDLNLTVQEREGLKCLIRASQHIDNIFKMQTYSGNPITDSITDFNLLTYMKINYGPWDRLNNDESFIKGIGKKPLGANFYPSDMRPSEFDSLQDPRKSSPYTIIVRENGNLKVVPYNEAYIVELDQAAQWLRMAADMLQDPEFSKFLRARAEALINNEYDASDRIWLDMTKNKYDIIIGPIENYEDKLYGTKTAYEAYVLIKDIEWSKKLEKYVAYLPELQKKLPVENQYKAETPGSSSQLNAYDAIYYAGDCNSGSKTIAVNLPNDEKLQLEKGTRRSQLKNVMKAKFDYILMPIVQELIDPEQRKHVNFNAFFTNTMFHEVAHGLGIKNTINKKGTVKDALGANYSALEEGKADILGLFMVTELHNKKVLTEGELMDYYVTFVSGIIRSVRFGASSAHGKANMVCFNHFKEKNAFTKDAQTGFYKINFENTKIAINTLSSLILKLQGDGDLEGFKKLLEEKGSISSDLQADLNKLSKKSIPVDLVFEQGELIFDQK